MDVLTERFGEAVRYLKETGVVKSYKEVANAIGVTNSNLSMRISGTRSATWPMILQLSDHYNVSLRWLRFGEGELAEPQLKERVLLKKIERLERRIRELESPSR